MDATVYGLQAPPGASGPTKPDSPEQDARVPVERKQQRHWSPEQEKVVGEP